MTADGSNHVYVITTLTEVGDGGTLVPKVLYVASKLWIAQMVARQMESSGVYPEEVKIARKVIDAEVRGC